MRQFDVVRLSDRSLALVLQADLLDGTNTVVVSPLVRDSAIKPVQRLNPIMRVGRGDFILLTEKLSAVLKNDVQAVVASLRDRDYDIRRALDIVFAGV